MNRFIKALLKAIAAAVLLTTLIIGYTFMVLSAIEINGYLGIFVIMSPLIIVTAICVYIEEAGDE